MSARNEHIGKLIEAREHAVKARRDVVAGALAQPYKRGASENMQEVFVKLQGVIEAIDRAIEDERRLEQIRQNTPQVR
jgi:hypothetical protein